MKTDVQTGVSADSTCFIPNEQAPLTRGVTMKSISLFALVVVLILTSSLYGAVASDSPSEANREGEASVVLFCDQFEPDRVYPTKRMDTCSVVNHGEDYGFTDFSQTYDMWIGGIVDYYGMVVEEIRGVAVADIPDWLAEGIVTGLELSFHTYEHNNYPFEFVNFSSIESIEYPHAGSSNEFWQAYFEDSGEPVYYSGFLDVGWHHFDLGQAAIIDFEARQDTPGWFGVGLAPAMWELWPGDQVYNKQYGGGREPQQRPYFTVSYVLDDDGDGYHVPEDCDDDNSDVNPGQAEILNNGVDDDCDGKVDELEDICFVGLLR